MPKSLWFLIIGMLVNVTGASFLWPLNTIYINEHLGKSLSVAGVVLMLNSAASVVGNLLGGTLFDKIGGYKSILSGIIITLIALVGLVFFHDWPTYVVLLVVVGFGSGIVFPSMYAMAGSVWPQGGRKAFNAMYVAQNAGVAIGAAVGGIVASYSFTYIFLANTILYVIFLLIAIFSYRHISVTVGQTNVLNEAGSIGHKTKLTALLILCTGYVLCWVAYVQWQTTIATHTRELNIPLSSYSLLWTINGILIVVGQPLIVPIIQKVAKTLKVQVLIGTVIFVASFIIVVNATTFPQFLTAMVVLTIGEMFVWPAIPAVASQLAPSGKEGFYQGVVNSMATAGKMIGPLFGGVIFDAFNMSTLCYLLIALLLFSMCTTWIYDYKLKEKRQRSLTISK
ncbi:MFS transporter [Priestia megaterium]|uniref:MDR family MFS transporter n=1 Tax=Priestia megaterium TaxID=1404 RepID=UPI002E1E97B2|nr:MFS transporter [Priestia megaterium]MED4289278.1 MFS transporter [Priestia megaterium]MED4294819.1 MFS transporter [Priestia megaterium]